MGLRVSNGTLLRMGPANWHGLPLANLILEVTIFSDRGLQETTQDFSAKYLGHTMALLIFNLHTHFIRSIPTSRGQFLHLNSNAIHD